MKKRLEHEETTASAKVGRLVMTGLFMAMTCVATMVLVVPSPSGGYMNLGDAIVLLGAFLLGPVYGGLAGGIGAAIADLLAGYAVYAPATLGIKLLMGLVAGILYRCVGNRWKTAGLVVCCIVAESIMVIGYWLYDGFLMGSLAGSAVGIPANLMQAAFGIVAATLLTVALRKTPGFRKFFES